MFSGSVFRLTVALFVACVCTVYGQNKLSVPPNKDARCHQPKLHMCNVTIVSLSTHEIVSWFYHASFKSCHPLWGLGGKNVCSQNLDLPKTKRECEDLCREPCIVTQGINKTMPGICMLEQYCKLPTSVIADPRPCRSYNVRCCPRDYQLPTATLKTKPSLQMAAAHAGHGESPRTYGRWN